MLNFLKTMFWSHGEPLGYFGGPILGPNRRMLSKLDGPGPLGSKGYPNTSFNSGKFPDTYQSFLVGVIGILFLVFWKRCSVIEA